MRTPLKQFFLSAHRHRKAVIATTSAHPHLLSSPEVRGSSPSKERAKQLRITNRPERGRQTQVHCMQGLEFGPRILVSQPAIFIEECINDFLHGQVGNEVFLGQSAPGHRFKMVHTFSFSSVSFDIIDDATGCATGFLRPFRAGLATPLFRHFLLVSSLSTREKNSSVCHLFAVFGLSVGLLGLNVAVVLASLVVPRIHQFSVWLSNSEPGETEVQLTLLGLFWCCC